MRGKSKAQRMVCEGCGLEFPVKYRRLGPVLCPRCREAQTRKNARTRKAKPANTELTAVAARAHEAHMTYGQYVASMRK